jgi:glycosyltransferase involved in cell wall biosynthesis
MRIALLTHEPFYPPSGGGSAEAVYLVRELVRRGHAVHLFGPPVAEPDRVRREFGIELHPFTRWRMGRTTALRSVKYLLYPAFLQRLVEAAARTTQFDLILSQHAISAVAAGPLRRRLGVPVVMNFLDFLTGFMETWPGAGRAQTLRTLTPAAVRCRRRADGVGCAGGHVRGNRLPARPAPADLLRLRCRAVRV